MIVQKYIDLDVRRTRIVINVTQVFGMLTVYLCVCVCYGDHFLSHLCSSFLLSLHMMLMISNSHVNQNNIVQRED